jgi:hypothetical protein
LRQNSFCRDPLASNSSTSRLSDDTVIFSLEHLLSGGTKLTWGDANKLGKPVLHVYDNGKERIFNSDLLRLEVQALTD